MHITKVELENIKSHIDSKFEFQRGTSAITGENGAGKTTIIEAIAWTVFDLLDYKKEDFVRRGSKKGIARVSFESGLDEREYTVYRDTGTGYYVYDPQLKLRIADKKEEVTRFLWPHLGLEPGTDLEALFRRAIGVPQGTLTAIFLESATERKRAFDKLLKVEEYRRGADELLKTARYIELQTGAVREKIARAEGELSRFEHIQEEHKKFAVQSGELSEVLDKLGREVAEKIVIVKRFDEIEDVVTKLDRTLERLRSEMAKAEVVVRQRENDVERSREAAASIKLAKPDAEKHLHALARLKELERERHDRDKVRSEMTKIESALVSVRADQKKFQENLENALKAHQEIARLTPQVKQYEELEGKREKLRNDLANAKVKEQEIGRQNEQIERMRDRYRTNQAEIKEAEAKAKPGKDVEYLQKRDLQITQDIARLKVKLETDEKFQSEIQNGLCPILSEKCLNLKEGQTLESFLKSQFSETRTQIGNLEIQREKSLTSIKKAREAERSIASLAILRKREADLTEEGKRLRAGKEALEKELGNFAGTQTDFEAVEAAMAEMGDPQTRIRILRSAAEREMEIREKLTEIEKNLERLESDRKILAEQAAQYETLDEQWAKLSAERDETSEAHRTFLANESLANVLEAREKEFEERAGEFSKLMEGFANAENELEAAGKDYDRGLHRSEKDAVRDLNTKQTEARATFEAVKRRADELSAEMERLAETRKAMQAEFREKERLEKIAEATVFIRDTLKEAAPRVARNYVFHVSVEANQMFREIMGNAEHTLKWEEDYGIMLEQDGYDRPFASLSGGEQMAAALSVRLALLKQLSDVRIAFFDEPTANMDAERRENLAQQMSRITHFDQLFVISHDDTFEGYADNIVSVESSL